MKSLERFERLLSAVNKNYKAVNARITKLTAKLHSNNIPKQDFFKALLACGVDQVSSNEELILKYCGQQGRQTHIDYERFLLCLFQPPRRLCSSTPRLRQELEGQDYLYSVDRIEHFWNACFGLRTGYASWQSFEKELYLHFQATVSEDAMRAFVGKIQIEIRKLTASATQISRRWLLGYISEKNPKSLRSRSSALRQKLVPLSLNCSLDRLTQVSSRPRHNQTFSFSALCDRTAYFFSRLRHKLLIRERCRIIKAAALADKGSTPFSRPPRASLTPKVLLPTHTDSVIKSSVMISTPIGSSHKSLETADGYREICNKLAKVKESQPVPQKEERFRNTRLSKQETGRTSGRTRDSARDEEAVGKKYKLLKQRYSEILYERSLDRVKAEAAQSCMSALETKLKEEQTRSMAAGQECLSLKKEVDEMAATIRTTHLILAFYKLASFDTGLKTKQSCHRFQQWRTVVQAERVHEEHCLAARTMVGVLRLHAFTLQAARTRLQRKSTFQQWREALGEAKIVNGDLDSKEELSVELCQSASAFTKSFHETRVRVLGEKENLPPPGSREEVVLNDSIFASSGPGLQEKTYLNNTTTLFEYSNPSFHRGQLPTSPSCPLTAAQLVSKPGRPAFLVLFFIMDKLQQKQRSAGFTALARFKPESLLSMQPSTSMLPDVSSEIVVLRSRSKMEDPIKSETASIGANRFKRTQDDFFSRASPIFSNEGVDLLTMALTGAFSRTRRSALAHLYECRKYLRTRAEEEQQMRLMHLRLALTNIFQITEKHLAAHQRVFISRLETASIAAILQRPRMVKSSNTSSRLYSPTARTTHKMLIEEAYPLPMKSPLGSAHENGSLATTDICFSMRNDRYLPASGRIQSYYSGREEDESQKLRAAGMVAYLRKLFAAREEIRVTRAVFTFWYQQMQEMSECRPLNALRMQTNPLTESFRMRSFPAPPTCSTSNLRASLRYGMTNIYAPCQTQEALNMSGVTSPLPPFYTETLGSAMKQQKFRGSGSGQYQHHHQHQPLSRSISPILNQSWEDPRASSFNALHTFAQNSQRRKESVVSMEHCLSPAPLDAHFDTFYASPTRPKRSPENGNGNGGDYWMRQSSQELKDAVAFIKEKLGMQI